MPNNKFASLFSSCSLVILFFMSSCQRNLYRKYDEESNVSLYNKSIQSCSDVSKLPVHDKLLSVKSDSTQLLWKVVDGKTYVKTVMWKKAADTIYYKNKENGTCLVKRHDFVTLAPSVKTMCSQRSFGKKEGVCLRLEQVLGLKPKSGKTYFIEVWVRPENLWRPCTDCEITDNSCGLIQGDTTQPEYKEYLNWLRTNNAGYPFTQLGYTYDWNGKNESHIGLSEFIIKKNSDVIIDGFTEICDYCNIPQKKKK